MRLTWIWSFILTSLLMTAGLVPAGKIAKIFRRCKSEAAAKGLCPRTRYMYHVWKCMVQTEIGTSPALTNEAAAFSPAKQHSGPYTSHYVCFGAVRRWSRRWVRTGPQKIGQLTKRIWRADRLDVDAIHREVYSPRSGESRSFMVCYDSSCFYAGIFEWTVELGCFTVQYKTWIHTCRTEGSAVDLIHINYTRVQFTLQDLMKTRQR